MAYDQNYKTGKAFSMIQDGDDKVMKIRDTLKSECVLDAIEQYMDAKLAHDKARDAHEEEGGYSWGYHGHNYIRRKEEAAEAFDKALMTLLDARLKSPKGDEGDPQS